MKIQRAPNFKNRISKETHDKKIAEHLIPTTKKLDTINESRKKLVEDENTQTTAIENITGTQSLPDTLTLMMRSKNFFKLEEKSNGGLIWHGIFIQPIGENRINVKNEEYDITPNIETYFTNTKLTTKFLNNIEQETVLDIHNSVGFYDMKHTNGLYSARLRDALYNLPKTIPIVLNPPLPAIENVENS